MYQHITCVKTYWRISKALMWNRARSEAAAHIELIPTFHQCLKWSVQTMTQSLCSVDTTLNHSEFFVERYWFSYNNEPIWEFINIVLYDIHLKTKTLSNLCGRSKTWWNLFWTLTSINFCRGEIFVEVKFHNLNSVLITNDTQLTH